jgi:hypothetical protein
MNEGAEKLKKSLLSSHRWFFIILQIVLWIIPFVLSMYFSHQGYWSESGNPFLLSPLSIGGNLYISGHPQSFTLKSYILIIIYYGMILLFTVIPRKFLSRSIIFIPAVLLIMWMLLGFLAAMVGVLMPT